MDGMGMMLKSLGFDPEKIKKQLTDAQVLIEGRVKGVEYSLGEHTKLLLLIGCSLQRIEMKLGTLPESELMKIIASKTPEEIDADVKEIYGRNDGGNNNTGN